jgi:ArsR family transcriptional regulator
MKPVIPDELLERTAHKFQMLGDSTRLAILRVLMSGERSVGQVVEETGRGQANVSKHLKMLAEAGLVSRRKDGLQVFYSVSDPLVEQLCQLVCASILKQVEDEVGKNRKLLSQLRTRG